MELETLVQQIAERRARKRQEQQELENAVVALKDAGASFQEIADRLGFKSRQRAFQIYKSATST